MKTPLRACSLLTLIVLGLACPSRSSAISLNQTANFSVTNTHSGINSQALSFTDFNSSLGTLNSVQLTFSGQFSGTATVTSLAALSYTGNIGDLFTLTNVSGATPAAFSSPITASGSTSSNFSLSLNFLGGTQTTPTQNSSTLQTMATSANGANLSNYVGSGNTTLDVYSVTSVNQGSLTGLLASVDTILSPPDR